MKVVLTGEGADEVLGGYDIFKEAKVRHFWAQQPESTWRPGLLKRLYPYLNLTSAQSAAYLKNSSASACQTRPIRVFRICRAGRRPRSASCSGRTISAARVEGSRRSGCATRCRRELATWHPFNRGNIWKRRRCCRATCFRRRAIVCSWRARSKGASRSSITGLIEFANRLHPRYKMRVLKEKHLLKQADAGSRCRPRSCSGTSSRIGRRTPPRLSARRRPNM